MTKETEMKKVAVAANKPKLKENARALTMAYMAKRSHSRYCCCGWEIEQPDGTATRSFKDAQDGSYVELQFIYSEDWEPMVCETWDNEYYWKVDGQWYDASDVNVDAVRGYKETLETTYEQDGVKYTVDSDEPAERVKFIDWKKCTRDGDERHNYLICGIHLYDGDAACIIDVDNKVYRYFGDAMPRNSKERYQVKKIEQAAQEYLANIA